MTNLRSRILSAMMVAGVALAGAVASQSASAHGWHHHHHYHHHYLGCGKDAPVVCAVHDGIRSNYPNVCAAHAAYAHVLHTDYCTEGPGCALYVPVCAWDPHTHSPMTFNNLCLAEVNNSTFLHAGMCH